MPNGNHHKRRDRNKGHTMTWSEFAATARPTDPETEAAHKRAQEETERYLAQQREQDRLTRLQAASVKLSNQFYLERQANVVDVEQSERTTLAAEAARQKELAQTNQKLREAKEKAAREIQDKAARAAQDTVLEDTLKARTTLFGMSSMRSSRPTATVAEPVLAPKPKANFRQTTEMSAPSEATQTRFAVDPRPSRSGMYATSAENAKTAATAQQAAEKPAETGFFWKMLGY